MARADTVLVRRREEASRLLAARGLAPPEHEVSELLAERCEAAFRARWQRLASSEAGLRAARGALAEADAERFPDPDDPREGFEARRRALAAPLRTLAEAGEAGVPHLAVPLMTDSWASILAIETLVDMPLGPLRDRAVVEALFCGGDWVPGAAVGETQTWDDEVLWEAFEGVARRAAEDAAELHSLSWVEAFDAGALEGELAEEMRPCFAMAVPLLYALGHHAALAQGFQMYLDLGWDGGPSVRRFLDAPCVREALEALRSAPTRGPVAPRPGAESSPTQPIA